MAQLADRLEAPASAAGRQALGLLIARVELSRSELRATASFQRLKETMDAQAVDPLLSEVPPFLVAAPLRLRRRGPELRLVLQGAAAPPPKPDPLLVRRLIEARTRVADYLDPEQGLTVSAIARRAGTHVGDVSRALQLAFLAPDLVAAILDGTQPVALTPEIPSRPTSAFCVASGRARLDRRDRLRGEVCPEAPEEAAASPGAGPIVDLRVGPASRASRASARSLARPLTPSRLAAGK
jgi:hypothetical protein